MTRDEVIAMIMREVLCEQVYRNREKIIVDSGGHVCTILGMRTIEPSDIIPHAEKLYELMMEHADGPLDGLNPDKIDWKRIASRTLDSIIKDKS